MTLENRLITLQQLLIEHGLDALLVPSSDEHLNEYVLPHGNRRAWISGFTGSAGDALITRDGAWLFVDSRYHLQVDTEVDTTAWQVQKLGLPGANSLLEQVAILAKHQSGFTVGACPLSLSAQQANQLIAALAPYQGQLVATVHNLVDTLWTQQPDYPAFTPKPVTGLPLTLTGKTCQQKIAAIQQAGTDAMPLVKLDQLAWLLNWRGADVPYNPFFVAYGLLTRDTLHLFTDAIVLPDPPEGVTLQVYPYAAYLPTLQTLSAQHQWTIDPASVNWATQLAIPNHASMKGVNPITLLKAVKTPEEITAMQQANLLASVAICETLAWLDHQVEQGNPLTERAVAHYLEARYAEKPGYAGQSFNTIAGTGPNGAIVHYGLPSDTTMLNAGHLFLLDSGAHYWGGTTDTTRTVCIGTPTHEQRQRYTLVLKAHLALSGCVFPRGANGAQLDGITRLPLWQAGLDYGHGTGHGVGAFLSVHEGPNGVHKAATTAFQPGMVTSIEPGFYQAGWGGIRLENLAFCVETASGWLAFEPLTWVPFCRALVDVTLLTPTELEQLNHYQTRVHQKVHSQLNANALNWLNKQLLA
jgi:Xaa-Pro aminopeptidase